MPYNLVWNDDGVHCVYEGTLTDEALIAAHSRMVDHDEFESLRFGILDFTGVEQFEITSSAIQSIARKDQLKAESNPNLRIALVAPYSVIKGFARMWELTGGEAYENKIFDDLATAQEWLGN